jgi:hypothetical protein
MDVLTSSEFRKHYASITAATEVTVGGRLLGTWIPATVASGLQAGMLGTGEQMLFAKRDPLDRSFNSVPFTPVPKKARA